VKRRHSNLNWQIPAECTQKKDHRYDDGKIIINHKKQGDNYANNVSSQRTKIFSLAMGLRKYFSAVNNSKISQPRSGRRTYLVSWITFFIAGLLMTGIVLLAISFRSIKAAMAM
jgi:hypothetical protein